MDPTACFALLQERAKVSNTLELPPPPPPAASLDGLSVGELARQLLARQEERVEVFRRFEEGFVRFLQVAEAEGYEALVATATGAFSSISEAVNAIGAALAASGTAAGEQLAQRTRSLQEAEREKLTLTAQLQIVRHGMAVDAHKAQAAEEAGNEVPARERRAAQLRAEEAEELSQRLVSTTERVTDTLDEIRSDLVDMDEEEQAEVGSETR